MAAVSLRERGDMRGDASGEPFFDLLLRPDSRRFDLRPDGGGDGGDDELVRITPLPLPPLVVFLAVDGDTAGSVSDTDAAAADGAGSGGGACAFS